MKIEYKKQNCSKTLVVLATTSVLLFTGCATTSPSASLPLVRSELGTSQEDGLNEFAPLEVRVAQDKIKLAEQAAIEEDHIQAERFSQEAMVNLKLAKAKASAKKAKQVTEELERNISTLRQEINR